MKSMQRRFGGLMKRSADEADVSVILNDFKQAEEMLDKLIKELKTWRDGWTQILRVQFDAAEAFATLYKPIVTADSDDTAHVPAETPQQYLQKCLGLQKLHNESRDELAKEVAMINEKLVNRVESAKLHAKPLKKTIKHRENMKLDYERYHSRVEHVRGKELRSQKEENVMAKHEADLAQAKINYQTADDHVKENFPGVTEAIYSLIPYVLTTTVMLQTTLVGQLYTVLDAYTRYQRMPNPAPGDAEIVSAWDSEYTALRKELETSLQTIANGKAVHMSMTLPETKATVTGFGVRDRIMGRKPPPEPPTSRPAHSPRPSITSRPSVSPRASIMPAGEQEEEAPSKPPRPVSNRSSPSFPLDKPRAFSNNYGAPPPPYQHRSISLGSSLSLQKPSWAELQSNGGATPPSRYATPTNGISPMPSSASNLGQDYFASRRASNTSSIASAAAAIGAKKKAPPIPVKRIPSATVQYVTALYDFDAQSAGDLPFKEGDRIRVIKKTDSVDDWWTGEFMGATGSFPANYVEL